MPRIRRTAKPWHGPSDLSGMRSNASSQGRSTAYVPQSNERVTIAMPHQAGTHATVPAVVIGPAQSGWSTVRILEAPPGEPWPVIDVPNRRIKPTAKEK